MPTNQKQQSAENYFHVKWEKTNNRSENQYRENEYVRIAFHLRDNKIMVENNQW